MDGMGTIYMSRCIQLEAENKKLKKRNEELEKQNTELAIEVTRLLNKVNINNADAN